MPDDYDPTNDATAGDPWNTAFLSDRDVSGQVPINYVPHPGVYLTPACFPNGTYDDQPFKKCLSNLLASEIRRFILDVYWDTLNRQFRLCPVELRLPPQNDTSDDEVSPIITRGIPPDTSLFSTTSTLAPRQATASNTTVPGGSSTLSDSPGPNATSTSTALAPLATVPGSTGNTLYQAGPYRCSSTIGIDTFAAVLRDYILKTSNTIEARLQLIIFNLHVAADTSNLSAPSRTLTESELPGPSQLVSSYLQDAQNVVYTPSILASDRSNLNQSWYAHRSFDYLPTGDYFVVDNMPNGDISTEDGWPNEDYVQLEQGFRFLAGFGSVDAQMGNYNFSGDSSLIFSPGTLASEQRVALDSEGRVTSGCFYSSTENQVAQVNSSWAVASIASIDDQSILGFVADNITLCGISPVLNATLDNEPANIDYAPYQTFGNQALFSWASGEPKNDTQTGLNHDQSKESCALMVSNNDYKGHWRVADCLKRYRVACREDHQPYVWRLSEKAATFAASPDACTGNGSFDVPRTGLENLYLYHHIQSISTSQQDPDLLDGVWINFNSIDVSDCWVTTGPNGTCPYFEDQDAIRQRQVLTPAIAALVVLILTALTILVKCNTNRRNSKIRKRGEGGWDYEGVPS